MKTRILIGIIILALICPSTSHAFGFFRLVFDAFSNQLGLDRGPIPKVPPKQPPCGDPNKCPDPKHAYRINFHIQAEGF